MQEAQSRLPRQGPHLSRRSTPRPSLTTYEAIDMPALLLGSITEPRLAVRQDGPPRGCRHSHWGLSRSNAVDCAFRRAPSRMLALTLGSVTEPLDGCSSRRAPSRMPTLVYHGAPVGCVSGRASSRMPALSQESVTEPRGWPYAWTGPLTNAGTHTRAHHGAPGWLCI